MRALISAQLLRGVRWDAIPAGECACCGRMASWSRAERALLGAPAIAVPYCADCREHVAADVTRRGAVVASSALLSLSLAASLPLLLRAPSSWLLVALVGLLSCVPYVLASALAPRPAEGHTTAGRAVWWRPDGALVCTSPAFARALSTEGVRSIPRRVAPPVGSRGLALAIALGPVAAPFFQAAHFPEVRVVNTGLEVLRVLVDGREVARVVPSVSEGPHAGAVIRAAAGTRHFTAVDPEGRVVAEETVVVVSGRAHLYAPASPGTCYWMETTAYGRAGGGTRAEPLGGQGRFWVLPEELDVWFAPAPEAHDDPRSTGGVLRALRQGPCSEAPARTSN